MGLSWGRGPGFAAARALAYNSYVACAHADPHFGGIGGFVVGARGSVPHAAACERSPVPRVIAKDAVGLGNHMPTFDIVEVRTISLAALDMPRLKFGLEQADLYVAQRHHLVLTISTGWGLLSWAPGISTPRLSSPSIVCRSSLAGCGIQ